MGEFETRIAVLEEKVKNQDLLISALQADLREKFDRLEVKLDQALRGKISWSLAFIFAALSTISTSLIVYELTR